MAERPARFAALRNFLTGGDDQEDEGQNGGGEGGEGAEDEAEEGAGEGEAEGTGEAEGGEQQEGSEGSDSDEGGAGSGDANQGDAAAATMAERRRWATVLTHENATGRFESATAMLVEDMNADAIIRVLGTLPKENAAASRLATTPRHSLGSAPSGEGGNDNGAAESRKRAVQQRNAGVGKGTKTTSAKQRLAAGGSSNGE